MKKLGILIFIVFVIILITYIQPIYSQVISKINLIPTDDAFVIYDALNPGSETGYEIAQTGYTSYLNISYDYRVNTAGVIIETPYLKFDLTDFESKNIESAKLVLTPDNNHFENDSAVIDLYLIKDNDWDERQITFLEKPEGEEYIVASIEIFQVNKPYFWDITDVVKENAGDQVTFALAFSEIFTNKLEMISFPSTQSEKSEQLRPHIELEYFREDIIQLVPTDDAYVAVDLNDPDDAQHYRDTNTGDLEFLRTWYAWNVTENQERIISSPFLKFDLSEIESEKVINANLNLRIFAGKTLGGTAPELNLALVSSNDWNESEITFNNKPEHLVDNLITNTLIDNHWYTWDVTDFVKQNAGSSLSIMFANKVIRENMEEVISFHSKETQEPEKAPVLEIEYSLADTTTDATTEGGGCLIATATYGTELAPQVQQLRELRDNTLLQTNSGTAFMESFNAIYYSFSPGIADLERQNPVFKEIVKLAITPMISSLSILNYVDMDSEAEVLGYGISLIILNLGMYVGIPASVIIRFRK